MSDAGREVPPVPTTELHDIASARLRTAGQRYTTRRRALGELRDGADGPLTIPQILQLDRGLAQSSAYRNLAVLEQADVVHRIVTNDDFARYELAEDLTEHHHHLLCRACGSVADFTLDTTVEGDLDRVLADVAATQAFEPDHHRLDLVGTCADCR